MVTIGAWNARIAVIRATAPRKLNRIKVLSLGGSKPPKTLSGIEMGPR